MWGKEFDEFEMRKMVVEVVVRAILSVFLVVGLQNFIYSQENIG